MGHSTDGAFVECLSRALPELLGKFQQSDLVACLYEAAQAGPRHVDEQGQETGVPYGPGYRALLDSTRSTRAEICEPRIKLRI